jgi:hypothetical protein
LHGSPQLLAVAWIVERVMGRVISCQSLSANHHTGADQGSPPFARGPGVLLPRVRSKLPEGTPRSWRLMAETSRAEKFPWSGAWLPRLRFSKADAMLPAGPPPVPQALPIAGGHQGQLVLSSPAFLQEPGHAVGPALPRIQLDQERANDKGGMILDCSGNRAAEPRLGLRGRRAEAHQVRNLRQSAERMSC